MDNVPEDQNRLIEKYVAGLMTEDEALTFEAFILSKPDWQAKVDKAGELFDQIQAQAWNHELEQRLVEQKPLKPQTRFSWQFSFMSSAVAFGLGALMVWMLIPTASHTSLGKTERFTLEETRSAGHSSAPETEILIDKAVDNLMLKLPVAGDLRLTYTVEVMVNGEYSIRKGYQPDEYGNLTFILAHQFNHDELITLNISTGGKVIREYQLLIKEK